MAISFMLACHLLEYFFGVVRPEMADFIKIEAEYLKHS